jgi:hypothetical protein
MCRRLLLLAASFPLICVLFAIGFRLVDNLWLPSGVTLPRISSIYGTTWAMAYDGRLFRYTDNPNQIRFWISFDIGRWQLWSPSDEEKVLSVHIGRWPGTSVVETDTAIWYYDGGYKAEIPHLDIGPRQVGQMLACSDKSSPDMVYVATPTQIAFFYPGTASWQIRPLQSPISLPLSASYCTLFYSVEGQLRFVEATVGDIGYSPDFQSIAISEGSSAASQPDDVVALASSGDNAWVLARSGDAYQVHQTPDGEVDWEPLPKPPHISRPLFVSGRDGHGFGSAWDSVDLWLADEDTHSLYWLSRDAQTWIPFTYPGQPTPATLASIATSYEGPAGTEVTRLRIIGGRLYRQRLGSANVLVGILDAAFLAAITTILLAASFAIKRRHSASRVRLPVGRAGSGVQEPT